MDVSHALNTQIIFMIQKKNLEDCSLIYFTALGR